LLRSFRIPFVLVGQKLLGDVDAALEHVDRHDAAVVDQFETRSVPRTAHSPERMILLAHPSIARAAVLGADRHVIPATSLVVFRNAPRTLLLELDALKHIAEIRARAYGI